MKTENTTNGALLCSLVQIVRVVIVRVILVGVLSVTVDVLIGHDEVLVIYVAIFGVIFCNWRCTLYIFHHNVDELLDCLQNLLNGRHLSLCHNCTPTTSAKN